MPLWQVTTNPAVGSFNYVAADGFGHSLFAQIVARMLSVLRVGAAICNEGGLWWSMHTEPALISFETEHSRGNERHSYNVQMLELAKRTGRTARGEHAGFCDLYAPIVARGSHQGWLVVGPFALQRASAAPVLERWHWLTGRTGHMADPAFSSYLSATLETLVLDRDQALEFEELVGCLAQLIAGEGRADELATRADALRVKLEKLRFVERVWAAVREMLDDRQQRTWDSPERKYALYQLGLSRIPDHALVALPVAPDDAGDAIDQAIRRDSFQRAAVELGRKHGDVVAGKVGTQGVVLLSAASGSLARKQQKLHELADRLSKLARGYRLSLCFGAAATDRSAARSRTFEAALSAAESALVQGARLIVAEADGGASRSLRDLRRALTDGAEDRPELLVTRFQRYLEAVALQRGHSMDSARGYLEAGFERIADAVLKQGALDEKSLRATCDALDRAAAAAQTTGELVAAYQQAVADLTETSKRPVEAGHERGLRAALDYVNQRYTEELSVEKVARVAGFAPNYFSKLFKAREKITFLDYVLLLRIERAKQLLASSELSVASIAKLSGFNSSQYFSRQFRRETGVTPLAYRANPAQGARKKPTTRK